MKESDPAFIPPGTPSPHTRCYVCRGNIGIFAWTDQKGKAHPWCIDPDDWNYPKHRNVTASQNAVK